MSVAHWPTRGAPAPRARSAEGPALLCLLLVAAAAPAVAGSAELSRRTGADAPAYTLGVFPYLSATTLEDVYSPIAAELARSLGRPVRFATTSSYEAFAQKLRDGEYDIAFVQPFDYAGTASRAGYLPVAAAYHTIEAVFFVTDRSPIQSAAELRGRTIGLPPKPSAVSYLARMALLEKGLRPGVDVRLRHFSSHQSCLQQLLIGNVDSCVSAADIARIFESRMRTHLRFILKSPTIPAPLFVAHARLPGGERERIRETLVSTELAGIPPQLRHLFTRGGELKDRYFRAVPDSEYDKVRRYLQSLGPEP